MEGMCEGVLIYMPEGIIMICQQSNLRNINICAYFEDVGLDVSAKCFSNFLLFSVFYTSFPKIEKFFECTL